MIVVIFIALGLVLVAGLVVIPAIEEVQATQTTEKCSDKDRGVAFNIKTGNVHCYKP